MSKFDVIKHSYKCKSYKDYPDYQSSDSDTHFSTERTIFNIGERIDSFKTKTALSMIKKIIVSEMKKDYYQNGANIREFVDIDTYPVYDYEKNSSHVHIENVCIWQNGFYTFNSFNMMTSSMSGRRKYSRNNFNEEMVEELRELNTGGRLYEIPLEDQGSPKDYANLESKIKVLSSQHEFYTE